MYICVNFLSYVISDELWPGFANKTKHALIKHMPIEIEYIVFI